jgi:hypothetical protein
MRVSSLLREELRLPSIFIKVTLNVLSSNTLSFLHWRKDEERERGARREEG